MKIEVNKYYVVSDIEEVIQQGDNPIVHVVEKGTLSSLQGYPFVCDLGGCYNEYGEVSQGWDEDGMPLDPNDNDIENLEREATLEEIDSYYKFGR